MSKPVTFDQLREAAAAHDVTLDAVDGEVPAGGTIHGRGRAYVPVRGRDLGALDGVHVEMPVEVEITVDDAGHVQSVTHDTPATDEVAVTIRQIASADMPTHEVEVDDKGRRILRRKRFFGY